MTLQLYYYYYEEEGSTLVSKVNTGGILAEERAAESWDCFPKFLAASLGACQSWYLCLIVITPPRADHYLAACLQLPSRSQKEIIRAGMLHRETCRCCSCRLPPGEIPESVRGGSVPPALRGCLLFGQNLISSPKSEIWGSAAPSTTPYPLSFLRIFPLLPAVGMVQPGQEKGSG